MNSHSIYNQLLSKEPKTKEAKELLLMQCRQSSQHWRESLHLATNLTLLKEVKSFIGKEFKIQFTDSDVNMLLNLYPKFRIDLLNYELADPIVQDSLKDTVMDFFLHCPYPTEVDLTPTELHQLHALVQTQAQALGFKPLK